MDQQIARYVSGVCSDEEASDMERRIREDNDLGIKVQKARKIWNMKRDIQSEWNIDRACERLRSDIYRIESGELDPETMADRSVPHSHTNFSVRKAPLRPLHSRSLIWTLRVASILLVFSLVSLLVFNFLGDGLKTVHNVEDTRQEVSTARGQRANIRLQDGTVVKMNVDSKLSYPGVFEPDNRTVNLTGEAYFDVAGDDRPFFVELQGAVVEIIGTAFTVNAYEDEEDIRVVVERGKVSLQSVIGEDYGAYSLEQGDMGLITRGGSAAVNVYRDVDLHKHLGWLEQRLVFDDEPLSRVVRRLERWYQIDIELVDPEKLSDRRLTTTFQNERLSTVLRVIEMSLDLEMETRDDRIYFYPAP